MTYHNIPRIFQVINELEGILLQVVKKSIRFSSISAVSDASLPSQDI